MNVKLLFYFSLFVLIMANWPSNNITNLQTIIQLIIIMWNRAILVLLIITLSSLMMLTWELSTV